MIYIGYLSTIKVGWHFAKHSLHDVLCSLMVVNDEHQWAMISLVRVMLAQLYHCLIAEDEDRSLKSYCSVGAQDVLRG